MHFNVKVNSIAIDQVCVFLRII